MVAQLYQILPCKTLLCYLLKDGLHHRWGLPCTTLSWKPTVTRKDIMVTRKDTMDSCLSCQFTYSVPSKYKSKSTISTCSQRPSFASSTTRIPNSHDHVFSISNLQCPVSPLLNLESTHLLTTVTVFKICLPQQKYSENLKPPHSTPVFNLEIDTFAHDLYATTATPSKLIGWKSLMSSAHLFFGIRTTNDAF